MVLAWLSGILRLSKLFVGPRVFFLQAEDGIRYRNVTGVQTCALPIIYYIVIVQQLFVVSLYYLTRPITFQLFLYLFHFFLRCCQANNYIPWCRSHSHIICIKIDPCGRLYKIKKYRFFLFFFLKRLIIKNFGQFCMSKQIPGFYFINQFI